MQGKKSTKLAAAVLFLTAILSGCGGSNPAPVVMPASPEGQLAFYGRKVVQTAGVALDVVDQVTQARLLNVQVQLAGGTITKDQVPAIEAGIKSEARLTIATVAQISPLAKQLVVTLQVIEVASSDVDRTKGIEAARQILMNMQKLVLEGPLTIGDATGRQLLAVTMGSVSELLLKIALLLPPAVPAK